MSMKNKGGFAAVVVYIFTGAGLGIAAAFLADWWAVPATVVCWYSVWCLAWLLHQKLRPLYAVKLWMWWNHVDSRYRHSLLELIPYVKFRKLRDVSSVLALIDFYRYNTTRARKLQ